MVVLALHMAIPYDKMVERSSLLKAVDLWYQYETLLRY